MKKNTHTQIREIVTSLRTALERRSQIDTELESLPRGTPSERARQLIAAGGTDPGTAYDEAIVEDRNRLILEVEREAITESANELLRRLAPIAQKRWETLRDEAEAVAAKSLQTFHAECADMIPSATARERVFFLTRYFEPVIEAYQRFADAPTLTLESGLSWRNHYVETPGEFALSANEPVIAPMLRSNGTSDDLAGLLSALEASS